MSLQFKKARALKDYEISELNYQRVSCNRRVFAPSSLSLEGDADLKVTSVTSAFLEIEFPTHVYLGSFNSSNPFANKVTDIESLTSRQLFDLRQWKTGQSFKLRKSVLLRFADDGMPEQTVQAFDEVRVLDDTYPRTFLVRETIMFEKKFAIYFICQ